VGTDLGTKLRETAPNPRDLGAIGAIPTRLTSALRHCDPTPNPRDTALRAAIASEGQHCYVA
jgi:hypothetical protein